MLLILTTSLIHFSLKGWQNVLFELGSERVELVSKQESAHHVRDSEAGGEHQGAVDELEVVQLAVRFDDKVDKHGSEAAPAPPRARDPLAVWLVDVDGHVCRIVFRRFAFVRLLVDSGFGVVAICVDLNRIQFVLRSLESIAIRFTVV